MPDLWSEMEQAFQDAARGLAQAHEGLGKAIEGLLRATRVSKETRVEQEDLRVTVARLERLVMDLVARLPPKA